jgi:hypothetical protein
LHSTSYLEEKIRVQNGQKKNSYKSINIKRQPTGRKVEKEIKRERERVMEIVSV